MKRTLGIITVLSMMGIVASGQSDMERIAELERKVDLLSNQVENDQFGDVFIEVGESEHGMGPAASKVYAKEQGVSIGGYGEALYQGKGGVDSVDFLRAVLYFGYKYNEKWVFNSEIEFEHASTGESGSASVEFAYLDYLHSPSLNLRAGLLLVPVGLVNELHEPNVFLSARRPDVENRIIPTTWRENGVGLFGDLGESVSYKAYVVNGLDGGDFTAKGLRGGRQKGSKAKAEDLAGVVRVDVEPAVGLTVGGSIYYGNSGQDLDVDVTTELYEAHLDYRAHGFSLRALGTIAQLDDVAELNRIGAVDADGLALADSDINSIGEEMEGWYVELGYDVFNRLDKGEASLTPFVRYEEVDTQSSVPAGFKTSGTYDFDVVTFGLNFKPIDELVFKLDYQVYDDKADSLDDQVNLAMGYVF